MIEDKMQGEQLSLELADKNNDAQNIIDKCVSLLKKYNKNITPRLLDYLIWNYQRSM